jgi:hypothetical protein
MKGHVSIETMAGGAAFTGSIKIATTTQGRTMDVTMKMSGKYLGADCGTVAPHLRVASGRPLGVPW